MLEAYVSCPWCGTSNVHVMVPPFSWWELLFGRRCRSCGRIFAIQSTKEWRDADG
jgi:hypothetical protein